MPLPTPVRLMLPSALLKVVPLAGVPLGASEWAVEEEGTTPSTFVDVLTQNPRLLPLSAGDAK